MTQKEIWKDIPNFEGYYQASNLGRVKSLDRVISTKTGQLRLYKGMIINGSVTRGYRQTSLSKDGRQKTYTFSQIIAITFLGYKLNGHTLVVDHINGDRADDRVENLRIVTNRENCSTCFRSNEDLFISRFVGVHWFKRDSKWRSKISYNNRTVRLGNFDTELEASRAYQSALAKIKDGTFNPNEYKPKYTSEYKGVGFHKASGRWQALITINGERKYLGLYKTELEAYKVCQNELNKI